MIDVEETKKKLAKPGKDREPVVTGYVCEECGTIYKDLETKNGVPLGVEPSGKQDQQDTIAALRMQFQDQITEMEGKLIDIAEALLGEDSDLAVKIGGILSGSKAAAEAEVPKPKLDSEAE